MKRKAAKRPAPRTVEVTIEDGDFAGWWAIARADFPARLVAGLESGKIASVLAALEAIIVEHNMPDSTGEIATTLGDVDPYSGLLAVANAVGEKLRQLPNR